METKHTPGPWVVRDADTMCPVIDSPNVGKGYWASLATATQRDPHPREGGGISMETARANARLIAAAPELLEALEELIADAGPRSHHLGCECGGVGYGGKTCKQRMDMARSAIAKARGTT